MDFDLEELAAIIEQLDKTEFTEFRFEKGDVRIAVRRGPAGPEHDPAQPWAPTPNTTAVAAAGTAPSTSESVRAPEPTTPTVASAHPTPAPAAPAVDAGDIVVTAPMLGTFYGAPKPGEAAFVAVGDKVDADEVVCIVEVMKLMNSVTAGARGEISAVFAADGDLVEFGQPLFAIRPIA